jgi:PPOX class probable F420-dependent enzyme
MDRDEARRRFALARAGHLATVRPDGGPHVVPFVFAAQGDAIFWAVDRKPKRSPRIARLANIEANDRVEAVVDDYDERWERLWWVRATGHARIVDEPVERARAVEALVAKYPQYQAEPPEGPVIRIDVDMWTWWEASKRPT